MLLPMMRNSLVKMMNMLMVKMMNMLMMMEMVAILGTVTFGGVVGVPRGVSDVEGKC